ncbi:Lon-like ATP-dependent protease La [Gluconobacter thailandicus F149-1 = NBRC 100600]|uniref:Peptidase n=2 Tax=Gluconobacter thailandicus TaxID=257438 RepID=A0AAP9ERH2_GLUTH|nr:LON peptidase substrate-binding domain-containing protein [Gluconobacter thailandicus]AFW01005.1 ATP-dependent protease La [Gluconobacter oxydans H24]ANQ40342.1 peptidase [Gluconobacter oxydans]GAN90270.1 Lon-like ATP-dependent protease La [Gluconobacter frateurii M-2]KXV52147.1 peptidase [Gluconobacter thailandicus]QEH95542.1 peptidase [Gluconobacter thailandicus]
MTRTPDTFVDLSDIPRRVPALTDLTLADLPPRVGLFPVSGAMLLPGGQLPLNVFEPRYVALLEDALAERRLIGMIQPQEEDEDDPLPVLHDIGTLGRITSFTEHPDGTFSVTLLGVTRFRLLMEGLTRRGWREGAIDASPFFSDLVESDPSPINRSRLLSRLKDYLTAHELQTDWSLIDEMDDEMLLVVLPMLVPFSPTQKQALLEAGTLDDRAGVLLDLLAKGME